MMVTKMRKIDWLGQASVSAEVSWSFGGSASTASSNKREREAIESMNAVLSDLGRRLGDLQRNQNGALLAMGQAVEQARDKYLEVFPGGSPSRQALRQGLIELGLPAVPDWPALTDIPLNPTNRKTGLSLIWPLSPPRTQEQTEAVNAGSNVLPPDFAGKAFQDLKYALGPVAQKTPEFINAYLGAVWGALNRIIATQRDALTEWGATLEEKRAQLIYLAGAQAAEHRLAGGGVVVIAKALTALEQEQRRQQLLEYAAYLAEQERRRQELLEYAAYLQNQTEAEEEGAPAPPYQPPPEGVEEEKKAKKKDNTLLYAGAAVVAAALAWWAL